MSTLKLEELERRRAALRRPTAQAQEARAKKAEAEVERLRALAEEYLVRAEKAEGEK